MSNRFFALNHNKFFKNTHTVFLFILIILWTSLRQCWGISLDFDVHPSYIIIIVESHWNCLKIVLRIIKRCRKTLWVICCIFFFWRLKAKHSLHKTHYVISSEFIAHKLCLGYLCSHLDQRDVRRITLMYGHVFLFTQQIKD